MPASTSAPEFSAGDCNHFYALLAQQGIGVDVPVVCEDDAGRDGDDVCAAVPLGAFAHVGVSSGFDHTQFLEPERLGDDVNERLLFLAQLYPARLLARTIGEGGDVIDDVRIKQNAV